MANEIYSIKVGSTTHPIALGDSDWCVQYDSAKGLDIAGKTITMAVAYNESDLEEPDTAAAFYQSPLRPCVHGQCTRSVRLRAVQAIRPD